MDLFIAEVNDLAIMARDVGNEYLNVPCQEKIWFAAGPEHGPEKTGKVMVMVSDLYGLKSTGEACIIMFKETLRNIYFFANGG